MIQANRFINSRSRGAIVKARVVRHSARGAPIGAHLAYLARDGVTRDGKKGQLFGPETDAAETLGFVERCSGDRHHFRFIISPDDAPEMGDLKSFARDLVGQMENDLGTRLDWVAVDHWNTAHPHVHLILRGVRDDGQDLVISRDYIKTGMRDRARDLITRELGPRTDHDIRRSLQRQVEADRLTPLDRQLLRDAGEARLVDLASDPDRQPDAFQVLKVGRLRKLERLGLAEEVGPGQWIISDAAEPTLRELGERGDIIKRMHRAMTANGIERGTAGYVLAGESLDTPVIGQLIERGLDDELRGSAYAVVDGVDGRTHHIRFADLDAAGDGCVGSIVELRTYDNAKGQRRVALAVRSDLDLHSQVTSEGATWLDRQAVARDPFALSSSGFGDEVRTALGARADHLLKGGLATRQGKRIVFNQNLIQTLRQRELDRLAERVASETGLPCKHATAGEYVSGTYRRRFMLASGRFAMIDDGLGFQLVPWTPSIERQLGRYVSGTARSDGGIDWSFGRKRGLGL